MKVTKERKNWIMLLIIFDESCLAEIVRLSQNVLCILVKWGEFHTILLMT
jgi:hypothetical protein